MSGPRRIALAGAALLSLVMGAGALAADKDQDKWETRIVADRPEPVVLNPAKAYILVHADYMVMPVLMRLPGPEDAAAHARRRADALAKEQASWKRKFASWEAQMKRMEGLPLSARRPERPVEPTESNFGYPEYEQIHSVTLGPQNRFANKDGSTYLQEVPPGEYIFYGTTGICACLGTVAFDAPAGKVVAIELSMPWLDAWQTLPKEQRPKTVFDLPAGTSSLRIGAAEVKDTRFPAGSVVSPDFKPGGRRPNWFGLEADRVMPIEGVFRYERDKQIDLRASSFAVSPPVPAAITAASQ